MAAAIADVCSTPVQQRGYGYHGNGRQQRGEELPTQQLCEEPLPEGGDSHPRSLAAASAPGYGSGNGGGSKDSPRSGKDVVPMKIGNNNREEMSPRSGAAKNPSLRGGGAPAELGGLIAAK